ncbi:uncharacterized protein BDZ99DRAFT_189343 [Mytilinidion resinicola]|uniref:Uncharacterized protein n=1 Tax=Mytilinidion resinicola TaxID=574789 RepID=A0A6A6Z2Y8_9PEZI|nr:uncharacterized protein BDZ99DRAFT_189343 [Mytilinidion resinicola]KAF2815043.1 hypothetical protein BDZ99DRAFT_189343 [Mytilinidion resinicola]
MTLLKIVQPTHETPHKTPREIWDCVFILLLGNQAAVCGPLALQEYTIELASSSEACDIGERPRTSTHSKCHSPAFSRVSEAIGTRYRGKSTTNLYEQNEEWRSASAASHSPVFLRPPRLFLYTLKSFAVLSMYVARRTSLNTAQYRIRRSSVHCASQQG